MIDVSWNIQDEDPEAELTGPPRALLGTWHYLRNSLRREWRTWVSLAAVGAAMGLAIVVLLPPVTKSTVTLLMAHPANMDGPSAMATDVSLLNTREVAARTVKGLKLGISPEEFQGTVSAEAPTTEILTLTVSAPDQASAVARAQMLTQQYLAFRADQLRSLSSGLINGYKARIATLQQQVGSLNSEYAKVSEQGASGENRANEILTQRAELNARITDMQQAIEDAALTADAAISSTHPIDSARVLPRSTKRTLVADVGSGLIAGAALGVGFVLFRALTSDRLRRREDVALALRAPVRFSVASRGPKKPRRWLIPVPWARRRGWRGRDLEVLAHGLETALLPHQAPARPVPATASSSERGVALAAIGNAGSAAAIIVELATRLQAAGLRVFLADLSASGSLAAQVASAHRRHRGLHWTKRGRAGQRGGGSAGLSVFRPGGGAGVARGPGGDLLGGTAVDGQPADARRVNWEAADVVLVLAEVSPGIDAENLTSWVAQVVPLVTAGESTPELLQTTAELVRAAGLALPFALMVGSHETDESLGLVDPFERARATSVVEP